MAAATAIAVPFEDAIVEAGRRARQEEKFSAERRLHRWHEIGRALLVGRRLHENDNNAFGAWCQENSFGDIHRTVRTDALWLAGHWDEVWGVLNPGGATLSSPKRVRAAFNKAKAERETGTKLDTSKLTKEDIEYVRKLDALANDHRANEHERALAAAKRDEFLERFEETHTREEIFETIKKEEEKQAKERELAGKAEILMNALKRKPLDWLVDHLFEAAVNHPDVLTKLMKGLFRWTWTHASSSSRRRTSQGVSLTTRSTNYSGSSPTSPGPSPVRSRRPSIGRIALSARTRQPGRTPRPSMMCWRSSATRSPPTRRTAVGESSAASP